MSDVAASVFTARMRVRRVSRVARAQWLRFVWPGWRAAWGAQVGRHCRIGVEPGSAVVLGPGAEIDDGVTLAAMAGGRIELGDRAFVGHHSTIAARELVRIGARTFVAELVSVRDHDHDPDQPPASGASLVTPVHVGDDVWIAAKATVVRGVSIGDRCVVAAHAVVREDTPPFSVVAGVPAKVVRTVAG
jgi:carbonic anhydrase/acetyltransferase-like protein (isoleucine patch superfamily)